jgi:hypothetical protein
MNISYAITVCNEYEELQKLINHLLSYINLSDDEIVVLCDMSKTDERIVQFCNNHQDYNNIKLYTDSFDNHFANWKNKFKTLCSKDYIFQIDADEIPNEFLLNNIKTVLFSNPSIELYWVPRENYVAGITDEHIKKWSWKTDNLGRINFPDYQARLFKNTPNIRWQNPVHEIIVGAVAQATLPAEPKFCLLHNKNIDKQEKQNSLYDTIQ